MSTIGHFERLRALCGNARLLVTGGVRAAAKSQVVIFDHVANKVRHTLELPAHVLGMALAGERLLCACADGAVRIFEVASGKELQQLSAHRGACTAVAVSGPAAGVDPASERIYTAGADGRVRGFRPSTRPQGS
jgi:ParB family chromosome partitioning protein